MYFAIQEQKSLGLRKSQVSRNLNVSRNTVIKLWDMAVEEYKQLIKHYVKSKVIYSNMKV